MTHQRALHILQQHVPSGQGLSESSVTWTPGGLVGEKCMGPPTRRMPAACGSVPACHLRTCASHPHDYKCLQVMGRFCPPCAHFAPCSAGVKQAGGGTAAV